MAIVPLFGVAVPTFLVLSGFLAPDIPVSKRSPGTFRNWAARKGLQLLVPFLFWDIVMIAMFPQENPYQGTSAVLYWLTGAWHLYFIFVLFQLLAVSFFFQQIIGEHWWRWMLVAGVISMLLMLLWSELQLWMQPADGGLFEVTARKVFMTWLVFYAFGAWLRREPGALSWFEARLPWIGAMAGASYALYYAGLVAEERLVVDGMPRLQILAAGVPWQILGPLGLLLMVRSFEHRPSLQHALRLFASPSRYTFGIYLSHVAIMIFLVGAARELYIPLDNWGALICIAVLVGAFSYLLVRQIGNSFTVFARLLMPITHRSSHTVPTGYAETGIP